MNKELEFSQKYDLEQAKAYYHKHHSNWQRRLSNRREIAIARRGLQLAGNPQSVLDLPCGAGRFWPMLAEQPQRQLLAADYSADMLRIAQQVQPADIVSRFQCFQSSAFNIQLEDEAVEHIFCMRLLHHIGAAEDRLAIYGEFHRVCQKTISLSLWVDGNYKAWRRRRLEQARQQGRKPAKPYTNRFVLPAEQAESEFKQAGFDIIARIDFLPRYSMWRVYVLQKC